MPSQETTAYISQAEVQIDGRRSPDVSANVVAALVEETIDGLFRCEIVLNNFGEPRDGRFDFLFFDRSVVDFGKNVGLGLGPGAPPQQVFAGRITGLEAQFPPTGNSRLILLAEDRLQDLRMTRRTRNFEDSSDADIITKIAQEHGLTPKIDMSGPTHRDVAQVNLSDLAFLRERARAVNAEVWVEGTDLYAMPRTRQDATPIELAYGVGLSAFQVRADLAHQCTAMSVSGWDVANKAALEESVDDSAVSSEINGIGGSRILEDKFGKRSEMLVHLVPLTVSEARTLAEARYRERARRFVTGNASAEGDARLQVGRYVKLANLGVMFDGVYYVTRVRHLFDIQGGYHTEFEVERADIGR
ncbi:MAG: hypothetical protein OHK0046_41840 [Anaerolineae bacterium]